MDGEEIKCKEIKCKGNYHHGCSISETTWKAKSKDMKAAWRCVACRDKKKEQPRSINNNINTDLNSIEKELEECEPSVKQLLQNLLQSVQSCRTNSTKCAV